MDSLLRHDGCSHHLIHANAMRLKNGVGILIVGDAGVGKTRLSAALIQLGHQLIADDAVVLSRSGDTLIACASPRTRTLMHHRNEGIISIPDYFGPLALAGPTPIQVVIHLLPADHRTPKNTYSALSITLPQITLDTPHCPHTLEQLVAGYTNKIK